MPWTPIGTHLRALRERMGVTLAQLAKDAGLDEKTIRNLETGRTRRARTPTLRAIAAVLNADIADFARHVEPPPARWGRRRAVSASVEERPPPRLDTLVAVEYALGAKPPRIATEELGLVDPLTATMLQSIVTAHCVHDGERFVVTGRIVRQHGISPEEGAVLSSAEGIGARDLPRGPGWPAVPSPSAPTRWTRWATCPTTRATQRRPALSDHQPQKETETPAGITASASATV